MVNKKETKVTMPLGKKNYYTIAVSVVLLIVGFILLAGGGSDSPNEFNYDMFSARRLIVAPIILVLGYIGIGVGIMKKFKE